MCVCVCVCVFYSSYPWERRHPPSKISQRYPFGNNYEHPVNDLKMCFSKNMRKVNNLEFPKQKFGDKNHSMEVNNTSNEFLKCCGL